MNITSSIISVWNHATKSGARYNFNLLAAASTSAKRIVLSCHLGQRAFRDARLASANEERPFPINLMIAGQIAALRRVSCELAASPTL